MKVAVAVLILVGCLHAGEAVQCKVCPRNEPCKLEDTRAKMCSGSCVKETREGDEKSYRSCSKIREEDGCDTATVLGTTTTVCTCNSDLCNSGPSISLPSVFGLIILLAAARILLN